MASLFWPLDLEIWSTIEHLAKFNENFSQQFSFPINKFSLKKFSSFHSENLITWIGACGLGNWSQIKLIFIYVWYLWVYNGIKGKQLRVFRKFFRISIYFQVISFSSRWSWMLYTNCFSSLLLQVKSNGPFV